MSFNEVARPVEQAGASSGSWRGSRRMALLKRMGLFGSGAEAVSVNRAVSPSDITEAYKLVHDIFVSEGYIHPRDCGMRIRCFEAMPDTATFVAKNGDEIIGVQSLVVDSDDIGLPSDEAFKGEIDALRGNGRKVCEATNEAIISAFRKTPVPTELMRCLFAHAMAIGCNELITTVSPGHAKFYGLLGFEQISPIRNYSCEVDDPVVVVRLNTDTLDERFVNVTKEGGGDEAFIKGYYIDDNPYHQRISAWSYHAEQMFHDVDGLRELFMLKSDFLNHCHPQELDAIRRRWGADVLAQVLEVEHVEAGV